jgi:transposase
MREGVEVRLRPGDRERLEGVVSDRKSPQHHVWRARIVLLTADSAGTMAIRAATGKSKPTIWRWQARYMQDGADGLFRDAPRGRAFAAASPEAVAAVVGRTPYEDPPAATHWTLRAMAKASGLALDRTQPGLPMKRGRGVTMTHDYKRHGTTTLFAALDVKAGTVISQGMLRHRAAEFIRLLRRIDKQTPAEFGLHLLLDPQDRGRAAPAGSPSRCARRFISARKRSMGVLRTVTKRCRRFSPTMRKPPAKKTWMSVR